MSKKPDYIVSGMTLGDGEHWKQIGVAWSKKSRDGIKYISIALDFRPIDGRLVLWPAKEEDINEGTRFDRVPEEMEHDPQETDAVPFK